MASCLKPFRTCHKYVIVGQWQKTVLIFECKCDTDRLSLDVHRLISTDKLVLLLIVCVCVCVCIRVCVCACVRACVFIENEKALTQVNNSFIQKLSPKLF